VETFKEYIKYFTKKQRAGVVNLKAHVLYLIPPGETAKKIYEIEGEKMIGIFVPLADLKAKKGPPEKFLEKNGIEKPKIEEKLEIDIEKMDM
jgi:hypothetical protein